jgi:hypothetical protein
MIGWLAVLVCAAALAGVAYWLLPWDTARCSFEWKSPFRAPSSPVGVVQLRQGGVRLGVRGPRPPGVIRLDLTPDARLTSQGQTVGPVKLSQRYQITIDAAAKPGARAMRAAIDVREMQR